MSFVMARPKNIAEKQLQFQYISLLFFNSLKKETRIQSIGRAEDRHGHPWIFATSHELPKYCQSWEMKSLVTRVGDWGGGNRETVFQNGTQRPYL